jgi:ketosteroid isomerase-like protein
MDQENQAMKRRLLVAIIAMVISGFAAEQEGSKPASTQPDKATEQALEKRFREYADALTKRDLTALDKIWAPDYTFINPRGELVTKAERMANIKSGATEFQAINPQREKLHVRGNVAVDIGRVTLQGTKYAGKESSGEYRYMLVWVKARDGWQLLANQITLIEKK